MTSKPLSNLQTTGHDNKYSDSALFSRALRESRLPAPQILTFDGDPKRYKMFIASFMSNVDGMLDASDYQMKLTLLLQHCTGNALNLIEDCVILSPERGYAKALEKLEKRFGKSHQIASSYIDSVIKGGNLKLHDVDALVQLADDMQKCQTVLSQLAFTSDLDSTGTLQCIFERLPDTFQLKWIRRSHKIFEDGRAPTFRDLTQFVSELADEYSTNFGQRFAERMQAKQKQTQKDGSNKPKPDDATPRRITTLATETDTAGPGGVKPKCLHCERIGHTIWQCFKFKKLSIDERRDDIQKKNLCRCCLKDNHESSNCDKKCSTCGENHHSLIHEENKDSTDKSDQ